jgi:hypothetical protein
MFVPARRLVRPVAALAAAGTLVTGAVVGIAVGPATAASPKAPTVAPIVGTTTAPAVAAAGWLAQRFVGRRHQPTASGTNFDLAYTSAGKTVYSFDGGTTADAVFGLAASGTAKIKIEAAARYLAGHVAAYTSVNDTSGAPGPYDGQLGKTALAAQVAGLDPTDFGGYNLLATLQKDECTGPSGSATDFSVPTCPGAGAGRNIYSSVSESFVLLAEARGPVAYAPTSAARSYFLSLQCPNGGFTAGTAACTDDADADLDATSYAAMALSALGSGYTAELTRADDWLAGQQREHGYWASQGGPDSDSTGLAIAALTGTGHGVRTARAWLAGQQVTTGPTVGRYAMRGAITYQGAFDPAASVKATADALLGLSAHGSLATLSAAGAAPNTRVLRLAPARVHRARIARGHVEGIVGYGFTGHEKVRAYLGRLRIGTTHASKMGRVALRAAVPGTLRPGSYRLTLRGAASKLRTGVTVRVVR